jgi:hypothetical protein
MSSEDITKKLHINNIDTEFDTTKKLLGTCGKGGRR